MGRIPGGLWLHGSVGLTSRVVHQLSGWLAAKGIRLVPGRRVEWLPPIDEEPFVEWIREVEHSLNRSIGYWVVHLPADVRRRRFNILLFDHDRTSIGFAKLTENPSNPLAISALSEFRCSLPQEYWAPELIHHGWLGKYSFVVTTSMPNVSHGPARFEAEQRRKIVSSIQWRLKHLVAPDVAFVHGDFGPWNVRALSDGRIAVVDWEEATAGPVAADELWHAVAIGARNRSGKATGRVLRELAHYSASDVSAAARFWQDRLSRPERKEVDTTIPMPPRHRTTSSRIQTLIETLSDQG
jgi:hypothetical protein